jgi:hypothetical protein
MTTTVPQGHRAATAHPEALDVVARLRIKELAALKCLAETRQELAAISGQLGELSVLEAGLGRLLLGAGRLLPRLPEARLLARPAGALQRAVPERAGADAERRHRPPDPARDGRAREGELAEQRLSDDQGRDPRHVADERMLGRDDARLHREPSAPRPAHLRLRARRWESGSGPPGAGSLLRRQGAFACTRRTPARSGRIRKPPTRSAARALDDDWPQVLCAAPRARRQGCGQGGEDGNRLCPTGLRASVAAAGQTSSPADPLEVASMSREERDALKRRILAQHPHLVSELRGED